ncbi:MAG TPA: hypothetical protein VLQ80_31285, partial [Candidatus Saccharimonadia bacterium]|nr:hypothetical protein [Candidatus Saccharimonadia bacterium]
AREGLVRVALVRQPNLPVLAGRLHDRQHHLQRCGAPATIVAQRLEVRVQEDAQAKAEYARLQKTNAAAPQ